MTVIRSSTAIDPATGVAKRRSLRQIEAARAGSELHGDVHVADDVSPKALDVLLAASRLIEGIGGKRRRGLGRCTVKLEQKVVDAACDALIRNEYEASSATPATDRPTVNGPADGEKTHWRVTLDIITELPVIVPRQRLGNMVESMDVITGTTLLPAICALLEGAGIKARQLVADGKLKVSDAVPYMSGDTGPTPFALSKKKKPQDDKAPEVFNTLCGRPEVQAKQMRGGWVPRSTKTAEGGNPSIEVHYVSKVYRTHATIEDQSQRPTEAVGGVYTYEAIAGGQQFRTVIDVEGPQEAIKAAFTAGVVFAVGTSRKDDYGLVRIVVAKVDKVEEASSESRVELKVDEEITVWCLSDVITLGDSLRPEPTAAALARAIERAAGLEVKTLAPIKDSIRIRSNRRDGWHTTWGLPRPTIVSIAAGSVARFKVEKKFSWTPPEMVGERPAEGFGRISINPELLTLPTFELALTEALVAAAPTSSGPSLRSTPENQQPLLEQVLRDHWPTVIGAAVASHYDEVASGFELGSVTSTQLNQLRSRLDNLVTAMDWLQKTDQNWPKKAELIALLSKPTGIWKLLGLADNGPPQQLVGMAFQDLFEAITRHRARNDGGNRGSN